MKTMLTTCTFVTLGFLIHWRMKGPSETREEASKFLIITAAPMILFLGCMLWYNAFRSPYLIYIEKQASAERQLDEMKRRAESAETAKARAENDKQTAGARIKELEEQLSARSPGSKLLISGRDATKDAELARSRQESDQREKHRVVRERLGRYMDEGRLIQNKFLPQAPESELLREKSEWERSVEDYLTKHLDASYAARFRNPGEALPSYPVGMRMSIAGAWANIGMKVTMLGNFISELRD